MQSTAVVSYLEMTQAPEAEPPSAPSANLKLQKTRIDVDTYLSLQREIGEQHHWVERLTMPREDVAKIINDERVWTYLFLQGEEVVGFCEFDCTFFPEIELKFFGLRPAFVNRGLGSFFLLSVLKEVWQSLPHRVWLHTDSNDHPNALRAYQKAGFVIYKQEEQVVRLIE